MDTICGVDCGACPMKNDCGGCVKTGGKPFGGQCVLAACCHEKGFDFCGACGVCSLKERLVGEFNALAIPDLKVTDLNALTGAFINLEYPLPNGMKVKFLEDDRIYLGNQIERNASECYGVITDGTFLLVCTYGEYGADAKIVLYKQI